jgi:NitT/TauT family transport system substrate-binding protein
MKQVRTTTRASIACAAVALALVGAGCGSSSSDDAAGARSAAPTAAASNTKKLTTVRVGVLSIGTQVPLYLGIKQGFFAAEGLKIDPQVMAGGSAIVPALLQGSLQFGFVNGATVVFGASKGLPIQAVTGGEGAPQSGHRNEDLSRIMVKKGSPIKTPKDLEGKTISVSGLRDAPELLTRAALAKAGVDVSKLKFSEIPYADALAALDSGRVDASYLVTPFAEQEIAAGGTTLAHPYYDTEPGLATAYYCTPKAYAKDHPDVVAAFQRAMLKSQAYANDHLDEARALLPSFTKIPDDIIPKVNFGRFPTTLPQASDSLALIAKLMTSYGWIDSAPDKGSMVFAAGGAG